MRKLFVFVASFLLFAFISTFGFAAQAVTNNDVVNMVKAGLSQTVIVQMIQSQPGHYDTSPQALIALKAGNVPDTVIAAMLSKGTGAVQSSVSQTQSPMLSHASSNSIPTQVGVYLVTSPGHYKAIPQEVGVNKTVGFIHHITELPGETSQTLVNTLVPTFLVVSGNSNVPVNVYPIMQIKNRERIIENQNKIKAHYIGAHDPNFVPVVKSLVDGPNVYLVKPSTQLQNGEYTFLEVPQAQHGADQNQAAWSFTVRAEPTSTAQQAKLGH